MDYLKPASVILAAVSSILATIGTSLLLLKKLRPTCRKYPDRPHIWVPVGFWSYVLIHWMMVYGFRFSSQYPVSDPQYPFHSIARGATAMASLSLNQLENFENFEIAGPITMMSQNDIQRELFAGIKSNDFSKAVDVFEFKTDISQLKSIQCALAEANTVIRPFFSERHFGDGMMTIFP